MQIQKKELQFVITLGKGTFGDSVSDTVTLSGLRASVSVASVGGTAQGTAEIAIFGMSLDTMRRLTLVGPVNLQMAGANTVTVSAGDEGTALSTIFAGSIFRAYAAMNQSPDVPFIITAQSAGLVAIQPSPPNSIPAGTDVATVFSQLATQAGLQFENSGVSQIMPHLYLTGSIWDQIKKAAQTAQVFFEVKGQTLAIWPQGIYRTMNVDTLELSPTTGMIGYPEWSESFISIKNQFLPQAALGQQMNITGSVSPGANRSWSVLTINHVLETITPMGQWFTNLTGFAFNDQ